MSTPKPKEDPLAYIRERIAACPANDNNCRLWPNEKPQITVRPLGTNHPVGHLFAPDGRRRRCPNPACVNPDHFQRVSKRIHQAAADVRDRIASCAPYPDRARAALDTYPVSMDTVIIPCWLWHNMLPQMTVRPLGTAHPVNHFFAPLGRRRVCADRRCVNPYHFARAPRPPSTPKSPMLLQCEEEVRTAPSLRHALEFTTFPRAITVMAYRNLYEDRLLEHQKWA